MPQRLSAFEAEHRSRWDSCLQHHFPGQADAIARGWELADLLADRRVEPTGDVVRRFMNQQVAVIGDSLCGVRFHPRDKDFTSGSVYFRVVIYPGEPDSSPQCCHYEVCVLGNVAAMLWPFGIAALTVPAEHYIVSQTF